MRILVRSADGAELARITDAEYVPRVGEEIVLFASSDYYRKRWQVTRVITATDPDQTWPRKQRNVHLVKSIMVEVEALT